MKTSFDENGALSRIAEGWLDQVVGIGQMAIGTSWEDEDCFNELRERVIEIKNLLEFLEKSIDLRYTTEPFAYCHTPHFWPSGTPPGGHCRLDAPLPSVHVAGIFTAWHISRQGKSIAHRFTRAAAWVAINSDFDTGLHYLVDLLRDGVVVDPDDVSAAIMLMIAARAQAEGGRTLANALFGKSDLSEEEWCAAGVVVDLDVQSPSLSVSGRSASKVLLLRFQEMLESVRDSADLDTWTRGVCLVSKIWRAVAPVTKGFLSEDLQWGAILVQVEEAACDAFAASMAPRRFNPVYPHFDGAMGLVKIVHSKAPADWLERVVHERLLVPRAAQQYLLASAPFLDQAALAKDDAWNRISFGLFVPACLSLLGVPVRLVHPDRSLKGGGGDTEDPDPVGSFKSMILTAMEVAGNDPKQGVTQLSTCLRYYPWSSLVLGELAVVMDQAGRPAEALALLERTIIADPGKAQYWQSLGVVLHRLGHLKEGLIAQEVARAIDTSGKEEG